MTTSRSIFSLAIAAGILFTPSPASAESPVSAPGEEPEAKICLGEYCAECWEKAGFHQCRIEKVGAGGCYVEWNDEGVFAECYDETTVGGGLTCDFPHNMAGSCEVNGVPFDPTGREACVGEACVGCNTADDVGSEKFYLECYACFGFCCCGATCTTNDGLHCVADGCSGCG